ncbi:hypothetical protein Pcinc_011124 [Petrolisthes cinctipes]|uniref:BZIP domain-containing protein n=1 Tax=Petrolisthes cinctipes TaxID=88211 RepID=A0AAE1KUR4_PETCI|nr:hypothetical protein Pcinc_011124 [Petrolisthes cinctipes]
MLDSIALKQLQYIEKTISLLDLSELSDSDVSESSSDDDLIHKLSNDLELPLALDDFEPSQSWPLGDFYSQDNPTPAATPAPTPLQTTTTPASPFSAIKFEVHSDMTAEELTRALYPNLTSGTSLPSSPKQHVKCEPDSPPHTNPATSPTDSDHIWELLCAPEVRPTVKILDTPPVTPPQSDGSPPHSPQPPSPITMVLQTPSNNNTNQHNHTRLTNNQVNQPIKVVTITTRNGHNQGPTRSGRVTKTMKIQPKVVTSSSTASSLPASTPAVSTPAQVINILNNTTTTQPTKLTLPKTNVTRTLTTNSSNTRIVQVRATPPPTQPQVPTQPPSCPATPAATTTILTTQLGGQTTMVPSATPLTPLAPALAPGMKHANIPDLKAFKRQQRMIKNRESASLSRKKKKEYLTALETNITELQNDNTRLQEENTRLQQRVSTLERDCATLRQSLNRGHSRKTTTALFALIFLFSINLGPLTSVLLSRESKLSSLRGMVSSPISVPSFHHRSLLWSSASLPDSTDTNSDAPNSSDHRSHPLPTNASHTCPMYFNATESLRLESELRDWFQHKFRPSSKKRDSEQYHLPPVAKKGRGGLASRAVAGGGLGGAWNALAPPQAPPPRLYRYFQPEVIQVEPASGASETGVASTLPRVSSFLEAIQRRDDTYYVVSFSPDHLLVPATARNVSARPRMSLLLPTPRPVNESMMLKDQVALMQIDCEVMDTRLIHVAQEVVPPHLRHAMNSTAQPPSQPPTPPPHPADPIKSHRADRKSGHGKSRPVVKPGHISK